MNIEELVLTAKFCDYKEREFELNENTTLKYLCCKKTAQAECDTECQECKKIYARYVIIDLRDHDTKAICEKQVFNSKDVFQKFQEDYISGIFSMNVWKFGLIYI